MVSKKKGWRQKTKQNFFFLSFTSSGSTVDSDPVHRPRTSYVSSDRNRPNSLFLFRLFKKKKNKKLNNYIPHSRWTKKGQTRRIGLISNTVRYKTFLFVSHKLLRLKQRRRRHDCVVTQRRRRSVAKREINQNSV